MCLSRGAARPADVVLELAEARGYQADSRQVAALLRLLGDEPRRAAVSVLGGGGG